MHGLHGKQCEDGVGREVYHHPCSSNVSDKCFGRGTKESLRRGVLTKAGMYICMFQSVVSLDELIVFFID